MRRGDVVLVDWPYSDRTGSKLRPAVVVQADFLNGLIDDTVLVSVSRTVHGVPGTEVVIDPAQETGSGLAHRSVASCANIMTADPNLFDQTLGYLSDPLMRQIDDCLKKVLALP
ncbi:MAG TPA: type II toxin-antitoxin system PemK/MazF family toxin [Gemmataceae bacterium]|jgi:mRNA interferase MazF|nr:type II toxin-antitoxin system PemK/MazF family toxin [Gemmataceae bacterium]